MIKINVQAAIQLAGSEAKNGSSMIQGKNEIKTGNAFTALLNLLAQGKEGNLKEYYVGDNQGNKEGKNSDLNVVTLLDTLFANQNLDGQQIEEIKSDFLFENQFSYGQQIEELLTSIAEQPDLMDMLQKLELNEGEKEFLKLFSDFAKETLEKINSGEDTALLTEKPVLQIFEQAFLNNKNIHSNSYIEKGEINFKRFFEELNQRLEQQNNLTRNEKTELRKVFKAMQEMISLQREYSSMQKEQASERQFFRQEALNQRSGQESAKNFVSARQAGSKPAGDNNSGQGNITQRNNKVQGEPAQVQKPAQNNNYANLQQISRQFNESNAGNQAQANSPANRAPVNSPLEGNINGKGFEARLNTPNSEGQAKTIVTASEPSGSKQESNSGNQQGFASAGKTATISLQGQQGNSLPQAAQMAAKIAPVIQQAASNGQGTTTLHIKLKPESLGEVTVRITYNQGNIQAHFIAATAHTREMLDQSMAQLRENLSQMNINLSDASTSSSGQEGQKWSQEQFKNEKNNASPGDEFFLPGEHGEDDFNEDEMDLGDNGLNYLV